MLHPTILATAALLGLTVAHVPAQAAPATPTKSQARVHPELQKARAHAAKLRSEQQALPKRHGAKAGPEDVTPPVLTAFGVEGAVNLRKRGEQAVAHWTLTDDLSGGYYVYAQMTGPSGQTSVISRSIGHADTAWSDEEAFALDQAAEPGSWVVDLAYVYDLRGNFNQYDAAGLAALGNTVVQVKNRTFDKTPPALVSGEVLTPTVTLSKNPPGMPYSFGDDLKVRVALSDSATGSVISGPYYAYLYFCLWEGDSCTYAISPGTFSNVWGQAQDTTVIGQRLTPGYPTGVYSLYQIFVQDNAGNWQSYTDINRGGETDFSTLFTGSTSFEVLP